jgi:hypothetical protein
VTYQPDYGPAIKIVRDTGIPQNAAENIVMALVNSGEMVCVPSQKHVRGRKSYDQLMHENWALRDWMGVLIDEYCAVNYHQYVDYAKRLLRRVYGKDSERPTIVQAADRLFHFADQTMHGMYGSTELRIACDEYRRVRGSR